MNLKPSKEESKNFALMLHVGLPANEAILYFVSDEEASDPSLVTAMRDAWIRSKDVEREFENLVGGKWEEMSLDERIRVALDKHYSEKAYFLFARNFSELSGSDLSKAQEARKVLEAKLAGTSGKLDPLGQFWDDLKNNKVQLGKQLSSLPA